MVKFLLLTLSFAFVVTLVHATKERWDQNQSNWTSMMKAAYKGDTLQMDSLLSCK